VCVCVCVCVFPGGGSPRAEEVFRGGPPGRGCDPGQGHGSPEIRSQEEVSAFRGQDLSALGGPRVR